MSRDYRANLLPIDDQTNADIAALLSGVTDDKRQEMLARIRASSSTTAIFDFGAAGVMSSLQREWRGVAPPGASGQPVWARF